MWRYASYCLSESIEEEKNKGIDDEGKTCEGMFSLYLSEVLLKGTVLSVWKQTGIRQPVLPGIRKDKMTEKYPSFSDQIQ